MAASPASFSAQAQKSIPSSATPSSFSFPFGEHHVRAIVLADSPWFVASDVAAALGYRDAHNMIRNLDDDEKGTQIVSTLGGTQAAVVVSESGLYAAILRSRRPEARKFRKWVTGEVLPSIRKAGLLHLTALTRGLNPDEPQVMTVNEFATQYLAEPTRGDKIRLGAMAGSLGTLAGRDRSTTQRHGTRCRVHTPQALMRAAMALGLSFK